MSDNYEDMTVAEIKALLKEAGLKVSGKKSELIERLVEAQDVPEESEVVEETTEEVSDEVVENTDDSAEDAEEDDWDDEDWDEEEDEGHVAKQKPVLSEDMKLALALRDEQKKKTPAFKRTEWFRYKRLSRSGWRAPHGMDSKQRRNYKYRSSLVRVGHGKVATARGLHPSGFREVMVHNTGDLDIIDPETEAARVGKTVGGRKREQIYSRADELGIRVLNRRRDV
ncbi:MAG: 50S ribosomal protein L32e [Candidatus Poseidoniaceae archaeon]|nr:50S ribosomal protein L32e [Candidatus Poseidoniaceae archaeon]MBL6895673.1 50S ribosomal protein L32e [Candidatus Poseidoniaceae archaeon]MDA8545804.1 50S ribosomal protein L32e [Candidatus Poseidoniales archaeon]